jgi:large subunit ribosomal protein L20
MLSLARGIRGPAGPRLSSLKNVGALNKQNMCKTWSMGSLFDALPCAGAMQVRGMANYRHKKIIKLAKGYRGRTNCYTVALQRVHKARQYAYRDRKVKKREFRKLWIQRINAGCRMYNFFPYSVFMNRLGKNNIGLNRKVLADMVISEPLSFRSVLEVAKADLR